MHIAHTKRSIQGCCSSSFFCASHSLAWKYCSKYSLGYTSHVSIRSQYIILFYLQFCTISFHIKIIKNKIRDEKEKPTTKPNKRSNTVQQHNSIEICCLARSQPKAVTSMLQIRQNRANVYSLARIFFRRQNTETNTEKYAKKRKTREKNKQLWTIYFEYRIVVACQQHFHPCNTAKKNI